MDTATRAILENQKVILLALQILFEEGAQRGAQRAKVDVFKDLIERVNVTDQVINILT